MSHNGDGLTVLGLRAENVRGLKVVDLKPRATGIVKIKGKNGNGKSSTLDSIELVLNGKDRSANSPVRHGADSASIVAELGDLIVKRVLREDGTTKAFSVEKMVDGVSMAVRKPQEVLNGLIGSGIGFDPLEYAERLKPSEQVDRLLDIANLPRDPREIDTARGDLFGQRTLVNRELKSSEALLEATERAPEGTPDEEVSLTDLAQQFQDGQAAITANNDVRKAAADAQQEMGRVKEECARDLATARENVERIMAELKTAKDDLAGLLPIVEEMVGQAQKAARVAAEAVDALADPDLTAIQAQMLAAEATNKDVHVKQRRAEKSAEVGRMAARSEKLTADIAALDQERTELLTAATFPLPDLSIDEVGGQSCVTYHGVPLQDCSSSEKLRISLALAVALNPKVRVVLIREGSLLDDEAMAALEAFAVEKGVQIWVEEVSSTNDGEGFFIEAGEIQEVTK